jgi:transketolase
MITIEMQNMDRFKNLAETSLRVREHIIRMSARGGCFIGASLSCADLVVYLYSNVLNVSPESIESRDRDYFLLSKGHDVPAVYGTLAELGFLERSRLGAHLKVTDSIYWHPNRDVPGIEFHSGSLGHLLSVGIGIAMDIRLGGGKNRVFVLCGDGELNEGSMWEAVLVAASQQLGGLTLIVDRNGFQANVRTESLNPLEPLGAKFQAFGWNVQRIDGHDFGQMETAFAELDNRSEAPSVIIADTVRGKGLPSIEQRADRWFASFTEAEAAELINELHGGTSARLVSNTLIVR